MSEIIVNNLNNLAGTSPVVVSDIATKSVDIASKVSSSTLASSSGSSLVGYISAGTGAVATTVQSKLRESVSVKDFGAIGDGVADDTAAIQAAIDAVSAAGGGIVIIPPAASSYRVNINRISVVSAGYHTIALELKSYVSIDATGATIRAFQNNNSHGGFVTFEGCIHSHVIGGRWIGDKQLHVTLPAGEFCFAMMVNRAIRCSVRHATIEDSRGDGVYIGGCSATTTFDPSLISYDIEVTNNKILNCGRNGVSVVGCQRYIVSDNIITGTWGYAPQAGIDIEPDRSFTEGHNAIDGVVSGNVLTENHGDGLTIYRSSGLSVTGNTISRNGERGISMRGNLESVTISGNTVKYAGLRSPSNTDTNFGLYMDQNAGGYTNVVISNNSIDSAKTFFVSGGASDRINVMNNQFVCSGSAANLWGAQGTGTANTNSYFTSYINSADVDSVEFRGNTYRNEASGATWRGESVFFVSATKSGIYNNTFYNVKSDGLCIRLDGGGGATPYQFHYNTVNDNLLVGQNAMGYWSAAVVDFSRSVLNGSTPSHILIKTNAPATGWVMPNIVGNTFEYAYGNTPGTGPYKYKVWDGSTYKFVGLYV